MNSKDYIEITINIDPFTEENAEIVEAELGELPYNMFQVEENCLKAYIQREDFDALALKVVLSGLMFKTSYTTTLIEPTNWNKTWEDNFTPLIVGKSVTVKSEKHKNLARTRVNITLNPGMAFGTGHHQTTTMMMEAMLRNEEHIRDHQVMDIGCGTGILAILAAKMRAEHVWAIDIDAVAANSAFGNMFRNRVSKKVETYCGDASLLQMGKYDVLLANIHRNIIMMDLKTYAMSLKKGGLLVISGFYESDAADLMEEASRYGLHEINRNCINGGELAHGEKWCCIELIKE